jgi:hypothetical protein
VLRRSDLDRRAETEPSGRRGGRTERRRTQADSPRKYQQVFVSTSYFLGVEIPRRRHTPITSFRPHDMDRPLQPPCARLKARLPRARPAMGPIWRPVSKLPLQSSIKNRGKKYHIEPIKPVCTVYRSVCVVYRSVLFLIPIARTAVKKPCGERLELWIWRPICERPQPSGGRSAQETQGEP